jgi:nucleotide-binding universal stress UspA family protein
MRCSVLKWFRFSILHLCFVLTYLLIHLNAEFFGSFQILFALPASGVVNRFEKKEKVMRVEIKTIFCATDISDFSNHAVSWGIALAQEFRAKLYVCHVVDFPTSITYGDGPIFFVDQQSQAIGNANHQLKQLVGDKKVQWEPLVSIGHAGDEISRLAKEKGADLAISATHGRSGLKRLILGSVTERLMRTLHCPLLIVRGPKHDLNILSEQGLRFKKILVGCDFSKDSALALQHGLSLAQEFQSELHLVHVMEPLVYMDMFKVSAGYGEEFQVDIQPQIKDKLKNMVPTEAFNWCTPKTVLLNGPSHEELIRYSKINKMDLIVLGVRGQGLVERLFIGSTTDRVVRQTPCPVLSVCLPE